MSIANVEHPLSVVATRSPAVSGRVQREAARNAADSAEISAKSRELYAERSSFDEIRARIREGFYSDPTVIEETITNLLADDLRGLRGSSSPSSRGS
jgi:hypothetical protein